MAVSTQAFSALLYVTMDNVLLDKYGGYRADILSNSLTDTEYKMFICTTCGGLMRGNCFNKHTSNDNTVTTGMEIINSAIQELTSNCVYNINGCDWKGPLKNISLHLLMCDFAKVKCVFSGMGCGTQIEENQIDNHLTTNMVSHLLMFHQNYQKLERLVKSLKGEVDQLKTENQELRALVNKRDTAVIRQLEACITSINIDGTGIQWTIPNVSKKVEESQALPGPYFYINKYKFQTKAIFNYDQKPNLALFVVLVRGEYDNELKWPFHMESKKLLLIAMSSDNKEIIKAAISTSEVNSESFKRPGTGANLSARGCPKFLTNEEILSDMYSMEDSITIRICVRGDEDDVEILKREVDYLMMGSELRGSGILWAIKEVKERYEQNVNLWGPAFYIGRYYFKLKAEFNFTDPTKAMGVFIAMFKGKYDEDLPWPFKLPKEKFIFMARNDKNEDVQKNCFRVDERNAQFYAKPQGVRNPAYGSPNFLSGDELLSDTYCINDTVILKLCVKPE